MGIKGLTKFLTDNAPKAVKELKGAESYTGKAIAIDASMCMYQFLIAIREDGNQYANLTNAAGEVTSHISGFLARTLKLMESGVKPVYVFDGKPPELKLQELAARREKKQEAEQALKDAAEAGDAEAIKKQVGRTVRATKEQHEQVKHLLRMMGVPVVEASGE